MNPEIPESGRRAASAVGVSVLLTAAQVASLLNLGASTSWRLNAVGKVPSPVRIGGSIRWREREIHAWIEAGCPSRDRWQSRIERTSFK